MRDWIAILSQRLAGLGFGLRLPRQRRDVPSEGDVGIARAPEASHAGQELPRARSDADVPNTLIPPLPENIPVAVLEFDGPPGPVPIRRGETVIGRHSEDDVRIRDVRISRHHARLTAGSDRCEIHNLTARRPEPNPMLVNGATLERAEVVDGDVISFGGVSFTFRKSHGGSA